MQVKEPPENKFCLITPFSVVGIYQCVAVNSVGRIWAPVQLLPTEPNPPSPPQNVHCRPFDDTSICLEWSSPPNVTAFQAYSITTINEGSSILLLVLNETM